MIDLYFWPTPNGQKISIFLEEVAAPYRICPINISANEQFAPDFLQKSPNNRIPAIVDHAPAFGGDPVSVFESGAILTYLADKFDRLLPKDPRKRVVVQQWLFWQVGGLGPMLGQAHHFLHYAPEKVPYGIERYTKETARLYGVLNKQLAACEYVAGEYSIADIAMFPWILPARQNQNIGDFPHVARWHALMAARPGVAAGMAAGAFLRKP
jgi:GSH-dependent disulfide-bond oxidoreductase